MPEPFTSSAPAGRTSSGTSARKARRSRDVIVEAGRGAIADAGIDPGDVKSGVVGNFAARAVHATASPRARS